MKTLEEIESAIQQLPATVKWELLDHLQHQMAKQWDQEIEADHEAGRLDSLIKEVRADISAGRVQPLHEVIHHI